MFEQHKLNELKIPLFFEEEYSGNEERNIFSEGFVETLFIIHDVNTNKMKKVILNKH